MKNKNQIMIFPDTFLDYIPDPSIGSDEYRKGLKNSYINNRADIPPIYALLKVTERCPSNCSYCAHAGNLDASNEVDTETLKRVIQQIAEVGVISINLTGGEPLLREDICQLSVYARECGLFPILLTNGLLIRKRIEEIKSANFGMIIISVDSVKPEQYQKTRGISLDPVLEGIEALLELKEDCPIITVTSVVNRHNISDIESTIAYFAERNIGVELCPYHHNGRWEDDFLSPDDEDEYLSIIKVLSKIKKSNGGIINSQEYLENFVDFTFKKRSVPPNFCCYAGYTSIYIDSKLNVRSCWSQGLPIAGNLYKDKLSFLLENNKMTKMRNKIKKLQCERCWLLCTAEISLKWK